MLGGSFPWVSTHEDHEDGSTLIPYLNAPPPRSLYQHTPRQLLVRCGELIASDDFSSAHYILSYLRNAAAYSPYGDSTDRLSYLFTKALSFCLTRRHNRLISAVDHDHTASSRVASADFDINNENMLSSSAAYLSLNQVTPFIRFSHLTANQAILEALSGHQSIHIIDFNILQGLQWPPLMQALVVNHRNPPSLRLTATGTDIALLQRTGSRLRKFAQSLGLTFHFHPVQQLDDFVDLPGGEALAVNAVHYFHRRCFDLAAADPASRSGLAMLLERIKGMNPRPKVVTLGEREASHSSPSLADRVEAAWEHYAAIFESMEATLPPKSKERMAVEQGWFGREMISIFEEGGMRHERFSVWEEMMREMGLENVVLSGFSVSQAKLLLRLHYPSEGYRLQIVDEGKCLLLGWQNHALFSVSSWRYVD